MTITTMNYEKRLSEVLTLLYRSPFFVNLIPFLRICLTNNPKIKIGACTKDGTIYLNKDYFYNKDVIEVVSVIIHEIMHLVSGDHSRTDRLFQELLPKYKAFSYKNFRILCNLIQDTINDFLLSEGFKTFEKQQKWWYELKQITEIDHLHKETHIRKLLEDADKLLSQSGIDLSNITECTIEVDKKINKNTITVIGNHLFATVRSVFEQYALATLIPGKSALSRDSNSDLLDDNEQPDDSDVIVIWQGNQYDSNKWENETERNAMVRSALTKSKTAGNVPLGLSQYLDQLTQPKIKWNKYVVKLVSYQIQEWVSTYKKRSRRQVVGIEADNIRLPGIKSYGYKCVIAVDTSGSISLEELRQFVSEIFSLVRRYNVTNVIVVPFDADVYTPIHIKSKGDVQKIRDLPGGGGTCISPFVNYVKAKNLVTPNDTVVIFTDGHIYDLDRQNVIRFLKLYRPIVVTTDKAVYPDTLINVKI